MMKDTKSILLSTTAQPAIVAVHGSDILIPAPETAREFGINRRTLARWWANPAMQFPQPTRINGRLYFSRSALEIWKSARLRASIAEAA